MNRLIVKNFGPLKDVDIELNKINLFIGENGSGKSVLGKLITILLDFNRITEKFIFEKIKELHIDFITSETFIKFTKLNSENYFFIELKNYKIYISNNLEEMNLNSQLLRQKAEILIKQNSQLESKAFQEIINKLEKAYQQNNSIGSKYIPAERNFIALFSRSLSSILVAEVPLPKFLISFISEFEKAGNEFKELEFLNVKYINGDGLDRHKVYFNDKNYLPLEHSSSGIQSALPLYLTIKYFAKRHSNIIIEEPEQNLFPKAQAETIKYIIEQVSDENSLFMMTHSPYVLSTLNILMMAYKAGNLNSKSKLKVNELCNEKQWINPDNFSAYYLENGITRDIKGRTGLISDNEIDEISDNIQGEFEEILSIYREYKNAK